MRISTRCASVCKPIETCWPRPSAASSAATSTCVRIPAPNIANIATCLDNLANLLQNTNRLAEAEPLYRRALAIDEKEASAPSIPTSLIAFTTWPTLLQDTNRLAEAEPLLRRALAGFEKSDGPGHPDVAVSLSILAELLQDTNRLAEAEPLLRRALAIEDEKLRPRSSQRRCQPQQVGRIVRRARRLAGGRPTT